MAKLWRESAGLIILARNRKNVFQQGYNYKVLLFTRSKKTSINDVTSFMPNGCCFPGGATERADESKEWINHFKNFGITEKRLEELGDIKGTRPSIFEKNDSGLSKEISLRISAIREIFKEVGVLICKNKTELFKAYDYGNYTENFDRDAWQKIVRNDPRRFLQLCKILNVIPDLWSLYEWSVWLTPAIFPMRFQTAFFLVALRRKPNLIPEPHEVDKIYWESPYKYYERHMEKDLWLPPPQNYELGRLRNMPSLDILIQFSKKRNSKGITLLHPVTYICKDGVVELLPGDDAYPENPEEITDMIEINESIKDFRGSSKNLHRQEYKDSNFTRIYLNFPPPNGHLNPVNYITKL